MTFLCYSGYFLLDCVIKGFKNFLMRNELRSGALNTEIIEAMSAFCQIIKASCQLS